MERRGFLKFAATALAVLAAEGHLPLLAAEKRKKAQTAASNWFTEPSAIEPVTGYLDQFTPINANGMTGRFSARYELIHWNSAGARSKNSERGSMDIAWKAGQLNTEERRTNRPRNVVKASIQCSEESNTAAAWTLDSSIEGRDFLHFAEKGSWDGKIITVKSKSWTQEYPTTNSLIARWGLLPLIASGKLKDKPLKFDMLDDSTLRPNQILRYEGEISVPLNNGQANLLSYVQTGQGIVPTHYLVDSGGRVQLITMSMVNWALTDLKTT